MTTRARHALCAIVILVAAFVVESSRAHPAPSGTLEAIRARGHVVCSVSNGPVGYASATAQGVWSGIGVDFCRALAVAVLDDKDAVKFRAVGASDQREALQSGEVDVVAGYSNVPPGGDGTQGIRLAGILLYDGQGFMVRRAQNIASALELSGARVCVSKDGSAAPRVLAYFSDLKMPVELVPFDSLADAAKAFDSGGCLVLSAG